jgi:hypothetical protein
MGEAGSKARTANRFDPLHNASLYRRALASALIIGSLE